MKQATKVDMKGLIRPASSRKVRTKFFKMIGIESYPSQLAHRDSVHGNANRYIEVGMQHPRSQRVLHCQEELKYNSREDICTDTHRGHNDCRGKQRKISFANNVDVVPIPKRDEYSDRIATRIWSSASEIHENAARNSVEFAAEG